MTYRARIEEGPRCRFHGLAPSTEECARCGAPVCHVCVSFSASHGVACPGCERAIRRGRALRSAGVAAVLLAAVGGVAAAYIHAAAAVRMPPEGLAATERALEANPCEEDLMLTLAELLRRANRDREVIERSEAFLAACGHEPRVLWKIRAAHNRRGEYSGAERAATRLLEQNPADGDAFCGRAESRERQGKLEEAAADYEQCIALRPHQRGAPVHLARVYQDLRRPCDSIAPLVLLRHYNADEGTRLVGWSGFTVTEMASQLATSADCQRLAVTGQALLPRGEDRLARGEAAIDGKEKGVFVVDPMVSHVLVQRAFADRIGLSAGPRGLWVWTPSGLQEAKLAVAGRLEVEGASAPSVKLAIVEDLPGVAGVLGLSFLLRFRVQLTEKGTTLSPPPTGAAPSTEETALAAAAGDENEAAAADDGGAAAADHDAAAAKAGDEEVAEAHEGLAPAR